jgi:hypothetical protein
MTIMFELPVPSCLESDFLRMAQSVLLLPSDSFPAARPFFLPDRQANFHYADD